MECSPPLKIAQLCTCLRGRRAGRHRDSTFWLQRMRRRDRKEGRQLTCRGRKHPPRLPCESLPLQRRSALQEHMALGRDGDPGQLQVVRPSLWISVRLVPRSLERIFVPLFNQPRASLVRSASTALRMTSDWTVDSVGASSSSSSRSFDLVAKKIG